jgi:hypothetical protein
MYPKFITNINKTHQYEELGEKLWNPPTANRKTPPGNSVQKAISLNAENKEP